MTAAPHLVQRLLHVEDLVRRRRADEYRRHVASQRSAKIDANPHQIEAVIFALARIPDGGCILADEVGLGKTIEAGLVIAQLIAEGARRVLVVTPKALLGQWKQELFALFAIDTREVSREKPGFDGDGVFLATRDMVGSDAGSTRLRGSERFDLCVVDEAHEVFAGIYKRFDRTGAMREDSAQATMAARLSAAIRGSGTPVLLLTATPIQNSLLELWGLVHYVDPTGTLLGDLSTFRQIFCPGDDRVLEPGQEHELQRRLATILQRTLRRQAQEFMSEPFTGRQARLFEYTMSPEERALYEDVTSYLLQPSLFAFRGNQRQLLLVAFHRMMASSVPALSRGLEKVASRLRKLIEGRAPSEEEDRTALLGDLEDDDESAGGTEEAPTTSDDMKSIRGELALVGAFIRRARANPTDSKALAMLRAVQLVVEQGKLGKSRGKVVIFTESLTTQDYLRKLLVESGAASDSDVTLFRGTNDSARAMQALEQWNERVGKKIPAESRPSPDVAMRLALVEEFRQTSRILISTEAGAKGLNLQFCDTVINYDLPWNPQRIEQRIGRCHRYGQQRDVTVINFLAADNETQRLTFEILSQKLDLFGIVLGASDEVLHRPGPIAAESLAGTVGSDFEAQLRRIYDRARTVGEVEGELRELRDSIEAKRREFESAQQRTEDIIQRRFDAQVRLAFKRIQEELPRELAEFDRDVERVVVEYLESMNASYRIDRGGASPVLTVDASSRLPDGLRDGTACLVGSPIPASPLAPLHLGHPLVSAAVADTRAAASARAFALRITASAPGVVELRGRRGRMRIVRVLYRGFESTDRIVPVAVLDDDVGPLASSMTEALLAGPIVDAPSSGVSTVTAEALDDALDELLFNELGDVGKSEQPRFEQTLEQIERFISDRILLLARQRDAMVVKVAKAEAARDAAIGFELREKAERSLHGAQAEVERLDDEIARLRAGDDEKYQQWRQHTQGRRYAKPEFEQVFEGEFEVV